jgi:pentatricopeptide repeat protein
MGQGTQPLLQRLTPRIDLSRTIDTKHRASLASSDPKTLPPCNNPADGKKSRGYPRSQGQKQVFEKRILDSKDNFRKALEILQEMKTLDQGASLSAYNAAINACARGKQPTKALELLNLHLCHKRMRSSGPVADGGRNP